MKENRRLAAIVSADVAGYSRLMGRDESGTLAALKELRREVVDPRIAKHNGRIVKTTGDGLLLEFASVVDAVRCVIEVQTAVAETTADVPEDRRIDFRIGVNIGDIIIEGDDIFGDGVNVAARLQEIAPPGGLCISGRAHDDVRDRLDAPFAEMGAQTLKNIARPITVWRWSPNGMPTASASPPALALPDKPSIAVLPFQNMSGDPEQEYFCDGITEDIITELTRFHEIFVIARNSSFTYRGRAVDVRDVAAELGVRYVLEGSIRRAAHRIRVTGQLIDASNGNHIWAERYDRVLEDVFAVQEELTQSIVGAIAPHIQDAEAVRVRRRPGNLGAYEIAVRAHSKAWEAYARADRGLRDEAMEDARAALAIDPMSTIALNTVALIQSQHIVLATADREKALQDGISAATRAIEADRNGNVGHTWKGVLLAFATEDAQRDQALAHALRGHQLNPHDSLSLMMLAFVEINECQAGRAIEHLEQAMRISPRDPLRHFMFHQLSRACFIDRRYGEGAEHALAAIREAPNLPLSHGSLLRHRIGLGDIEGGRAAFAELLRLDPGILERWRTTPRSRGNYRIEEVRRRDEIFFSVAAGLEDPSAAEALR